MLLKRRLADGEVLGGVLNVIPSPVVTQAIAAAGADFVLIDGEHGGIGREALHAMIAATAGTGCAPLVRVGGILEADVKFALDAGAEGVVFPLVRSADDARECVALTRYPPAGRRGWGPFLAASRWSGDYTTELAPEVVCGLLIETVEAVEAIDDILAVDGVDFAILAQFDLSTALGVHGRFDDPVFVEAAARIEAAARAAGVPLCGAALTPERTRELADAGYRLFLHGFDVVMLKQQVAAFRGWR